MEGQEIEHFVHAPGGKPKVAVAEDTTKGTAFGKGYRL
jgi:hypothetical protein